MHRFEGFRVRLTHAQTRHVSRIRTKQSFVYNWAVERLLADPTLTRFDLQKMLTKLRSSTPHLQEVERKYLETAIRQARTAADMANKYGKGNLRFRSRKDNDKMSVPCEVPPRFVDNMHASFLGLGIIQMWNEQPYQYPHNWMHGARAFMFVDITPRKWKRIRDGDRIYRLLISYYSDGPEPAKTGVVAGLDRGVANPTVVCKTDGETAASYRCYDTAVAFRTNQEWNDEARRTIARRNNNSRSTKKMRRQRESYNWHNANARDYAEWLLAKEICHGVDVICIEGLDIEAMTRKGNASKRGLNRGLRFIRHGAIIKKVRIVAERLGIRIVEVDPRGTSQTCCECEYKHKENRKGERFLCLKCGRLDNADRNAATNITQRGTGMKVSAGEGIALERREMGRTRKPPKLVCTAPDAMARRREIQARNRPETSSAKKHLGRYAYVS